MPEQKTVKSKKLTVLMKNFRELLVWQKSVDLVVEIYTETENFPDSEKFSLISQIRRAAISIPSNIAEGAERTSQKDFSHFLTMAKSSAAELETQIIISAKLGFLKKTKLTELLQKIVEIKKMLFGLRKSVNS